MALYCDFQRSHKKVCLSTIQRHNKTKVESIKLEKTFDLEIEFLEIGISVLLWVGRGSIQKPGISLYMRSKPPTKIEHI